MANIASARKRARQTDKRRITKGSQRSELRTVIKRVEKACSQGEKETANAAFKVAQSKIDSIAGKGVLHKNTAARHKKRLVASIKALD